jgi:DNA-binding CsgD family transcriptional regulator
MKRRPAKVTNLDDLTPRGREVLILVASGQSNKSIARCLGLSVNTVEKHRASLMKKLDVHNAAGLTSVAISMGLTAARRVEVQAASGLTARLPAEAKSA